MTIKHKSTRLVNFLEKFITTKYRNKLIILDNASSHRNAKRISCKK
jgi:hypothetical protein